MNMPDKFAGAVDMLHEAAMGATGLSDFGDRDYLVGLNEYLRAIDRDIRFGPGGREIVGGTILGALIARLHSVEGWKRNPDCLKHTIRKPLVITGVPRTGTTALHKLLSLDPQFQGLENWLTSVPQPRPPRDTWGSNPHYLQTAANLKAFFEAAPPAFRIAHEMVADEVDECLQVLSQSFCSNRWGTTHGAHSYDEWWMTQDETPSYRHYAKVVKLIGANAPNKRWLLKNPGHIWQIGALLDVFPDACIIQTHRTPVKAMPSLASVMVMSVGMAQGTNTDPEKLARRDANYWALCAQRMMKARESIPVSQVFDVDHREFRARPMDTVRTIYRHFGLTLTLETEAAMKQWVDNDPIGSKGTHEYSLEQFGLTEQGLREQYAEYIERYHLE
jgi:hypothetical protein